MAIPTSKVRLKLDPGAKGTRGLVKQYGDRLVCVRYRYDEAQAVRYKTAEIIVEKSPWMHARSKTTVGVLVHWSEKGLRNKVKQAGGKWSKSKKPWNYPMTKPANWELKQE